MKLVKRWGINAEEYYRSHQRRRQVKMGVGTKQKHNV